MSTDELLAEVLCLSRDQRARVAAELLRSLEEADDTIASAWADELLRRSRDVAAGRVQTVSWEAARTDMLNELSRRRVKHDVHVTPIPGGRRWRVSHGGSTVSTHSTQATAVDAGKREARRECVDLVAHGRDGKIRSVDSYRDDAHPLRDRRCGEP